MVKTRQDVQGEGQKEQTDASRGVKKPRIAVKRGGATTSKTSTVEEESQYFRDTLKIQMGGVGGSDVEEPLADQGKLHTEMAEVVLQNSDRLEKEERDGERQTLTTDQVAKIKGDLSTKTAKTLPKIPVPTAASERKMLETDDLPPAVTNEPSKNQAGQEVSNKPEPMANAERVFSEDELKEVSAFLSSLPLVDMDDLSLLGGKSIQTSRGIVKLRASNDLMVRLFANHFMSLECAGNFEDAVDLVHLIYRGYWRGLLHTVAKSTPIATVATRLLEAHFGYLVEAIGPLILTEEQIQEPDWRKLNLGELAADGSKFLQEGFSDGFQVLKFLAYVLEEGTCEVGPLPKYLSPPKLIMEYLDFLASGEDTASDLRLERTATWSAPEDDADRGEPEQEMQKDVLKIVGERRKKAQVVRDTDNFQATVLLCGNLEKRIDKLEADRLNYDKLFSSMQETIGELQKRVENQDQTIRTMNLRESYAALTTSHAINETLFAHPEAVEGKQSSGAHFFSASVAPPTTSVSLQDRKLSTLIEILCKPKANENWLSVEADLKKVFTTAGDSIVAEDVTATKLMKAAYRLRIKSLLERLSPAAATGKAVKIVRV